MAHRETSAKTVGAPRVGDPAWTGYVLTDPGADIAKCMRGAMRLVLKAGAMLMLMHLLGMIVVFLDGALILPVLLCIGLIGITLYALAVLGGCAKVGRQIWRDSAGLQRLSLVVAPIVTFAGAWHYRDVAQHALDGLMGGLYGHAALAVANDNRFIGVAFALFLQAVMYAALAALPLVAMHGLAINSKTVNDDHNRMTGTEYGSGVTWFYHIVVGYGIGFLAWCLWLPFFILLLT